MLKSEPKHEDRKKIVSDLFEHCLVRRKPKILEGGLEGVNWELGLDFLGLGYGNEKVNWDWDF